jgi:IclR helix-turn-helix domain
VNSESPIDAEPQPEDRAPEGVGSTSPAPGSGGDRSSSSRHVTRPSGEPPVAITLSRNQIDHVMRAALGEHAAPSVSGLVAGTGFHHSHAREMLGLRYRDLQSNRRLSRSLLAGLLVLSCFPPEGMDIGIKDISEQLDLNTSTVHRYVLTLVAAGLLERDPDTRRYRLLPE